MRVRALQHVAFEDCGQIASWALAHGHSFDISQLFLGDSLPKLESFDWLVVMGGPMSVHDDEKCVWLRAEKDLISTAINSGKIVLGVCLGAQLLAHVLGAKVTKAANKEIGWYQIDLTPNAAKSAVFGELPKSFTAFHWHGETFELPRNAGLMASSKACANQAFEVDKGRIVGLQFHLEMTKESVAGMVENCGEELADGPFIAPKDLLLSDYYDTSIALDLLLSRMEDQAK